VAKGKGTGKWKGKGKGIREIEREEYITFNMDIDKAVKSVLLAGFGCAFAGAVGSSLLAYFKSKKGTRTDDP
jgi:hypothetical protein